jgi:uncharacterized protein (TIGR02646 family)
MKYISKQTEPQRFSEWKKEQQETPNYRYGNLQNPEKKELHQSLLQEQGHICCYCQIRIELSNSHIEHLKPQSSHPNDDLEYGNLLASCQGENEGSRKPEHCGHKRGNELLSITPLDIDCEDAFLYTDDGQILANPNGANPHSADKTIEQLGLNIPKLTRMRASVVKNLDLDTLTQDDRQKFVQYYESLNPSGHYEEFCAVIVSLLKQ